MWQLGHVVRIPFLLTLCSCGLSGKGLLSGAMVAVLPALAPDGVVSASTSPLCWPGSGRSGNYRARLVGDAEQSPSWRVYPSVR